MVENYDVLKQNNLNQLVAEYEKGQQTLHEKRCNDMQRCHDYMKDLALQKLEALRERETPSDSEERFFAAERRDPRCFLWFYMKHFYDNTEANLKRKYAMIYDAKNLDKYPVPTPLPRMQDLLDPYMPSWMTYEELKGLATHCSRWRQK